MIDETRPTQNQLCTISAVITGALLLTLLFIPGLVFLLFSMAHEQAGAIMSRRAVVGAVEFLRDGVGVGIALAIIVELFLELAFLCLAKTES